MNAILRGTKECSASLTISPPFHFAIHRRLHDVLPSSGIARHPQVARQHHGGDDQTKELGFGHSALRQERATYSDRVNFG